MWLASLYPKQRMLLFEETNSHSLKNKALTIPVAQQVEISSFVFSSFSGMVGLGTKDMVPGCREQLVWRLWSLLVCSLQPGWVLLIVFSFSSFFSLPRSLYFINLDCTFPAFVQFFPSLTCSFLSHLMLDFSRLTIIPDTSFLVLFYQLCFKSLKPTNFKSAMVPLSPAMQIIPLFQSLTWFMAR